MLKLDWNLLWTIVNLIILFLLLKKFLFGPVCKMMDEREAKIKADLDGAAQAKESALKMKSDYEASIGDARSEALEITNAAKKRAEQEAENIIADAQSQSARILKDAEKSAEKERANAIISAQAEIASLAVLAAQRVGADSGNADKDMAAAEEFLNEVGES